jgi:hypothetical protein
MNERITTIESTSYIANRSAIARNDIEGQTILFQQAVEGLMRRDLNAFCNICEATGVVGESAEALKSGLVDLFASETHYKRRNKLKNQVTSG